MRHFLHAVQITGVIECVNARTQSAVQAKNAIRDDRRHGQIIKGIRKVFPHVGVAVLSQAFVVKAVDLGDLTTLVVSAEDGDAGFVAYFQRHEQRDGFKRIVSAVDVVAHEQIVRIWTGTADAKELG